MNVYLFVITPVPSEGEVINSSNIIFASSFFKISISPSENSGPTVEFKTDEKIIKLDIPQEMYDGLEIGQSGEVTLVEGELYSFII